MHQHLTALLPRCDRCDLLQGDLPGERHRLTALFPIEAHIVCIRDQRIRLIDQTIRHIQTSGLKEHSFIRKVDRIHLQFLQLTQKGAQSGKIFLHEQTGAVHRRTQPAGMDGVCERSKFF